MANQVEIKGLDELLSKLSALGGNVEKSLEKGVGNAAARVEADAKLLCPVLTGNLRRSITHEVNIDGDKIQGTVGTNVEYAKAVEFGSSEEWKGFFRGKGGKYKKGKRYNKVFKRKIAKPFLYPALKQNQENIAKDVANVIKDEIRKVADK